MLKIDNVLLPSPSQWLAAIRGTRNSYDSWNKADSVVASGEFILGDNDKDLLSRLSKAGPSHRKFLRMLPMTFDITAPLFWWKEYDTYKVGTVANSCSTMHRIAASPLTLFDFSIETLEAESLDSFMVYLKTLNSLRERAAASDQKAWRELIEMLPSSFNQRRTVMVTYEVLRTIYEQRKHHKLQEWRDMCQWIEKLPYASLICGEEIND